MITVPNAVKQIITKSPFLEDALAYNIINLSALSRLIKPQVEDLTFKRVEIGSILMALKRLGVNLQMEEDTTPITTSFKVIPNLIVRSNIFEITVINSPSLIDLQQRLLDYAKVQHSYFATITSGVFETTIIASDELKDITSDLYKNEKVVDKIENLASITIKFTQNIIDTPGVYYTILKAIAWEGIEITEVVSTYSEFTIILSQDNVDRAFSVIKKLFS